MIWSTTPLRLSICLTVVLGCGPAGAQEAGSARPAEVKLQPGQTLADIAEKYFEDPAAEEELRAYNHIPEEVEPKPGELLRLPGRDRDLAMTALRVAKQAIQQARLDLAEEYAPEQFKRAIQSMEASQAARSQADYTGCRHLADETWALARQARQQSLSRRPKKNRFAVSVDRKGTTRVEVMEGDGVKVTAGKKSATVSRGEAVRIQAGEPPEKPLPQLSPPQPILPNERSILVTPSIYFNWMPVAGASRYVLLISRDRNGLMPVRQLTTDKYSYLFRSNLPEGTYYWFLRTVDSRGLIGRASPPRQFTLRSSVDGNISVESVSPPTSKEDE